MQPATSIIPTSPPDRQLFLISHDAWEAASAQEVEKTVEGLKELNLYALPYPVVDIELLVDDCVRFVGPDGKPSNERTLAHQLVEGRPVPPLGPQVIYRVIGLSLNKALPYRTYIIDLGARRPYVEEVTQYASDFLREKLCNLLITLLATRNAEKVHHEHKLARLGIGKPGLRASKAYRYTTTISVPGHGLDDDEEHGATGVRKVPHLRRGHIRRQKYGPGFSFERKIWIEPVFVNADSDFVASRERYNLGVTKT